MKSTGIEAKPRETDGGSGRPALEGISLEEWRKRLECTQEGLSQEEAGSRLSRYGPNQLEEKKKSPLLKFLSYFWGPIPWMI
jgi:H+-transporting ATPase